MGLLREFGIGLGLSLGLSLSFRLGIIERILTCIIVRFNYFFY